MDVDPLICAGGPMKGNPTCPIFHNTLDDGLKYPWVGASFYRNLECMADSITKALQKTTSDFRKDPNDKSYMILLPDWKGARRTPC